MLTNEYLYGKGVEVPEIPQEIIVRRLEALNDVLTEIVNTHYLARDMDKQQAVMKAIKFWENINEQ